MRIEENRVFLFTFDTGEMGNIAIPVRGESREEGAQKLKEMFGRMQIELATEFPQVSSVDFYSKSPMNKESLLQPGAVQPLPEGAVLAHAPDGLSGILLERIDTLMKDLGGGELVGEAKAKTIHTWTELDFVPVNYGAIVHELELFASGAKEVPVKGKKK